MGLGSLIHSSAVARRPVIARTPEPRGRHGRSAGETLSMEIAAFRATYGFLPTARLVRRLRLPGAWRATMMYAFLMGSSPNHGYRTMVDGTAQRLNPNPTFLEYPAGQGPGRRTRMLVNSSAAIDMLWHGNAIGVVVRAPGSPWPVGWIGVPADAVNVAWLDQQEIGGDRIYQIGSRIFPSSEILHWQIGNDPNALRGLGIWETQSVSLGLAEYQQDQAISVSSNHGVPTGILTTEDPDVTPDELAAGKTAWLEAQRERTIAALGGGTKFQPVAWSPEAGQMVEARQFSLTEMENTFMLPIGWLGGSTNARTYSNIEQDAVNLLKFSWLAGAVPTWEEGLSQQMPRGQFSKNALDAILRSDTLTRYQAYAIAGGQKPWMTPDEIRILEDERPLGGRASELFPPTLEPAIQGTATVDPALEA